MKTRPLRPGWMVSYGRVRWRAAGMALTIWVTASAQLLVEPERIAAVRQAFDSAASARQMRCHVDAVRPVPDYAMRFRTGYLVNIPMAQFQGAGHSLDTYLRITPEGLKPTYLESTGNLPEVPATKLDGELGGTFVVGEGTYDVEALVTDDSHRACHAKWRIQARRSGSERELAPATAASTVEELSVHSFESVGHARRGAPEQFASATTPKLHGSLKPRAVSSFPGRESPEGERDILGQRTDREDRYGSLRRWD
jgi:hypothetical protein